MKLSYTTLSVQDRTIGEAVEIASAHGLEGIELRGRGDSHVSPESTFSYAAHVRELVREHKLAVPCLTAYTRFHQPTAAAVREEVDRMMDMVRLAEFLEAPCLRVFMGPVLESVSLSQAGQIAIEGLQYASKRLENSPVRLVIETHDSAKDGRTLARILKDVPSNIGVLLDIIHPWDMGEEIGKTWEMIGERIYHVHIKDISRTLENGRIYCPIGQGLLPVESTVRWLEGKGYQGFYSLEWEKSALEGQGVGFEEQLESFVSFMRGVEQDGNSQITL
ncbi:sugar phosphate isomerase/epimerase family protein [Enterocloster lavalensis]|uniref:sugar phosphate isomerase/epimerase family protein n=1 Tax=Enterocloster lavalensis TaxID=460384 RepID=UPI0026662D2C|nr:sugar phosphate isomerase/epimerase family protein [Enterocloster lavalensis]